MGLVGLINDPDSWGKAWIEIDLRSYQEETDTNTFDMIY